MELGVLTLKDVISLVLSACAFLLSLYVALRQGRNRVSIVWDIRTVPSGEGGLKDVFDIRAVNSGYRTLDIIELGLTDDLGPVLSESFEKPVKLEVGPSVTHSFDLQRVLEVLDQAVAVYAKDSRNHLYREVLTKTSKDAIRQRPVIEALTSITRSARQLARNQESFNRDIEAFLEDINEREQRGRELLAERIRKWKEQDAYLSETGRMHPEQEQEIQEVVNKAVNLNPDQLMRESLELQGDVQQKYEAFKQRSRERQAKLRALVDDLDETLPET